MNSLITQTACQQQKCHQHPGIPGSSLAFSILVSLQIPTCTTISIKLMEIKSRLRHVFKEVLRNLWGCKQNSQNNFFFFIKKKRKDCKGYKGSCFWKRRKPKHFKGTSRWSISAQEGQSAEISVTQAVTGDAKESGWFDSSLQREFSLVHFFEIFWFFTYSTYLLENNSNSFYSWLDTSNKYPLIFFS